MLPWKVNAWHALSMKTKPTHCFLWRGEEVNAALSWCWGGITCQQCVTNTHHSGCEQHCLGMNNAFPRDPAVPLTSGPLQLHAQNEVCGDTCTARGGDYAALSMLLSQIFPPCRCMGSTRSLPRRSGREMIMYHGTRRSLGRICAGRNLPSSLALSLLQPGSNLLMGFTSSSSWAVLVALLEDRMRAANFCLVLCGFMLPWTGNLGNLAISCW